MHIEPLFDPHTSTLTYVVFDPRTRDAVVIDPVLDYDPSASTISTHALERLSALLDEANLRVHFVLETHAHADHLSGSHYLKRRYGAAIGVGERIREVQGIFREVFDLPQTFPVDGSQFDRLFADGETFSAGSLRIEVIATPGHTPACVTYKIEDAIFTGDALFVEDSGTGRCDFPAGSADDLYSSVHDRLYALPDATRVFVGHDYQPDGRPLRFETTIGAQKRDNVQLHADTSREQFVAQRRARDATLSAPRLLYPSVQVNIDAGALPAPHANGRRYLHVPLRPTAGSVVDVDPQQVLAYVDGARIVDVREPAEFMDELGHVRGAELVPLATLDARVADWAKDRPLVLICRSGRRSERAAQRLVALGFTQVMNMRGGMLAWNDAHLPIVAAER